MPERCASGPFLAKFCCIAGPFFAPPYDLFCFGEQRMNHLNSVGKGLPSTVALGQTKLLRPARQRSVFKASRLSSQRAWLQIVGVSCG